MEGDRLEPGSSGSEGKKQDLTPLGMLGRVNGGVAVVVFAALTVVVALQVVTRFLEISIIWSEEIARFLFFWVVLLGAALSVKNRRHFVIDVTMGRRGPRGRLTRLLFDIVPDLCIIAFSVLLLVQAIGYTRAGLLRTATNSQLNMGFVYAAIPVFAALTILYSAGNLARDIVAFVAGRGAEARPPQSAE